MAVFTPDVTDVTRATGWSRAAETERDEEQPNEKRRDKQAVERRRKEKLQRDSQD